MENARSYGPVAKILHWLTVLLIAAQYAVGSLMPHIGRHTADEGLVAWHILIGAAIIPAIFLQLGWRLSHPVRLPEMPGWQTWLARVTHWMLYILVIAMVFLGWPPPISAAGRFGFSGWWSFPPWRKRATPGPIPRATSTAPSSMRCWHSSCCTSPARPITNSSSATAC